MAHPARKQPPPPTGFQFRVFREEEPSGATLCSFTEEWFIPQYLLARNPPAKPGTIAEIRTAAEHWKAIANDPPLDSITTGRCREFLERLRERPGRGTEKISPDTVYKVCTALQDILNHAGPAGQHCKRPAEESGLFGEDEYGRPRPAPWFPEVSRGRHLPRLPLTPEKIELLVAATTKATQPIVPECIPADWWSAFYRFLFWTGLRFRAGLATRRAWIQRHKDLVWLDVPAEFQKNGIPASIWLHPRAIAALDSIPTGDIVFPSPHTRKHLTVLHGRLLKAAGILVLRDYKFHGFRRGIGSALYEAGPQLAGMALSHARKGVTERNYVATVSLMRGRRAALKPAMDRIARRHPKL
jgi:integrase